MDDAGLIREKAQAFDLIREIVNSDATPRMVAERTRRIVWEFDDETELKQTTNERHIP